MTDAWWREGHSSAATPGQLRAGHRWKAKRDRWAPVGEAERLADFERAEALDEQERWKRS